jgi:hypothetical protein
MDPCVRDANDVNTVTHGRCCVKRCQASVTHCATSLMILPKVRVRMSQIPQQCRFDGISNEGHSTNELKAWGAFGQQIPWYFGLSPSRQIFGMLLAVVGWLQGPQGAVLD